MSNVFRSSRALVLAAVAALFKGSPHSHVSRIDDMALRDAPHHPPGKKGRGGSRHQWPKPKQFKPKHNKKQYRGSKHRY